MPFRTRALAGLLTLAGAATAQAQTFATDQAVWQVGGNVNVARVRLLDSDGTVRSDAATVLSLAPRLGYFLLPGLALTGNLSLGYSGNDLGHSWSWGLGPGLTWYFGRGTRSVYPYLGGLALLQWSRGYQDGADGPSAKFGAHMWQLSGGAVVLVARNVGINGELYYARTYLSTSSPRLGLEDSVTQENYGLQFGVSLFLY